MAIAGRLFLNNRIEKALVLCPSSVAPVWPREFNDYAGFPHEVKVLYGGTKKRAKILSEWQRDTETLQVAVLNYDGVANLEDYIIDWNPDLLICDESTRIKTPGAQMSKATYRIAQQCCPYRLILNGTPITQGPLDFFHQFKVMDDSVFGKSYYAFRNRYAVMGGFQNYQVIGYKNLKELTQRVAKHSIRVTKAQALDLPEMVDAVRYCELEQSAKTLYTQMSKSAVAELENGESISAPNVLAKILRLSQLCGGFFPKEDGEAKVERVSNAKLKLLHEVLSDCIENGEKAVIFCRFRAEIAAIKDLLEAEGIGYAMIYGDVPQSERGAEVERYQTDPECKVFVAQTATAGLGITLTAGSTAIFYSLSYSYADYAQAQSRLHRLGQKNNVTNIHLVCKGTVDEEVLKALQKKRNLADDVVDRWKEVFK